MPYQLPSWQTILDVLVIAAGLFFLYRTLIRLGTWKIVSGLLVAALFFVIASQLDLKGVEWIYRNVSHVAVLSLIVLFQPELRKIFERAASIRHRKEEPKDLNLFRLIAESMMRMASKGTGALMVIAGKEDIGQWISGGFRLASQPSMPLILSIFDPNSPGHDGAMILKNGIFELFGARLPISQSGRLSNDYGTRHQAAMGLSENSDALVVVVSEERRQVSLFKNGKFKPAEKESDIIDAILSHYRSAGAFSSFFSEKMSYKSLAVEVLGSLVAAIALWVVLISDQGEMIEKVITVPVEYTATAEDVVMTGDKAREARLHLTGAKSDLDAMSPSTLRVKVDLSQMAAGRQQVFISKENLRLPRDVELLDVAPASIEINIAKLSKTILPITPQLVGKLPNDLRLVAMEIKPDRLSVFIPSSDTETSYKDITTTPIFLDNIRQSTTLYCKVISPVAIQPVEKRWPDVEVHVRVEPKSDPKK